MVVFVINNVTMLILTMLIEGYQPYTSPWEGVVRGIPTLAHVLPLE